MKRLRLFLTFFFTLRSKRVHRETMNEQATYTRGYETGWRNGRAALLREMGRQ